jgi:hypothetical protein
VPIDSIVARLYVVCMRRRLRRRHVNRRIPHIKPTRLDARPTSHLLAVWPVLMATTTTTRMHACMHACRLAPCHFNGRPTRDDFRSNLLFRTCDETRFPRCAQHHRAFSYPPSDAMCGSIRLLLLDVTRTPPSASADC